MKQSTTGESTEKSSTSSFSSMEIGYSKVIPVDKQEGSSEDASSSWWSSKQLLQIAFVCLLFVGAACYCLNQKQKQVVSNGGGIVYAPTPSITSTQPPHTPLDRKNVPSVDVATTTTTTYDQWGDNVPFDNMRLSGDEVTTMLREQADDDAKDGQVVAIIIDPSSQAGVVQAFRFEKTGHWRKFGLEITCGTSVIEMQGAVVNEEGDTMIVSGLEYCSGRIFDVYRYNINANEWVSIGSIYRHDDEFSNVDPILSPDGSTVTISDYRHGIFAVYRIGDSGDWEQQMNETRPWACHDYGCYGFTNDGDEEDYGEPNND